MQQNNNEISTQHQFDAYCKKVLRNDSTLNRLIKLGDFPSCWFGIRGHYLRDDILEWVKKGNEEYFCDQFRLLRLL